MAKTKSKGDTGKKKAKSRKAAPEKPSAGKALALAAPVVKDVAKKPKGGPKKSVKSRGKSAAVTVAGFKIPKGLRKLGPIRDMLTSDLGREILADALVAAAGAAAMALTKTRGSSDVKTVAKAAAQGVMTSAAGTVAGVVSEAARHFLPPGLLGEGGAPASEAPAAKTATKTTTKGQRASSARSAAKPAAKRAAGTSATGRSAAKGPSATATTASPTPEPDRVGTDGEASSQG